MESACKGIVFTPAQTRTLSVIIVVIFRELAVARCCSVHVMFTAKVLLTGVITVAFGITNQRVRTEAWPTEWLPDYPRQVWNILKHPEASWSHIRPSLTTAFLMFHPGLLVRHRRPRSSVGFRYIYCVWEGSDQPTPSSAAWCHWVGRRKAELVGLSWFPMVYLINALGPHLSWPQWLPVVPATCYKAMQLPCPCNWKQWRP